MRDVVLGIGSNLGDSLAILQGCVDDLRAVDGFEVRSVSRVYETEPVGGPEQSVFLNAIVLGRTSLDDLGLLAAVQSVEQSWHRVRGVRWGPRTLDVDVIAINADESDDARLTIPHPLAHQRAFVLVPWLDVDPEAFLVGQGSVAGLVEELDCSGVRDTGLDLR